MPTRSSVKGRDERGGGGIGVDGDAVVGERVDDEVGDDRGQAKKTQIPRIARRATHSRREELRGSWMFTGIQVGNRGETNLPPRRFAPTPPVPGGESVRQYCELQIDAKAGVSETVRGRQTP